MKKIKLLALVAITILPSFKTFAGDDDNSKKGIRAGWQISNFYTDGNQVEENLSSFYLGVYGEKKLLPLLRLGSGIEYNSTGTTSNTLDAKFVRHAISVPVYLKVKLGPVFALGGAAANFGIANKFSIAGENVEIPDESKTKVFNLPVYLGLGVKFLMISIEARYHVGTLDLDKSNNSQMNNRYFQLGAAVSF
tara:strand:+ start:39403 stop:39981 length:579 start_codon:yes stop_codon:yes gene_type:complete